MYTQGQEKAKVGNVAIDIKGQSYRIRFTYPEHNRHEFIIAKVSDEGWTTAIKAAQLINRDIDLGDFDDSYARYSPKHAKKLQIAQVQKTKEYSLKDLWEMYKDVSKNRVSKTTQKVFWKFLDTMLERCSDKNLKLSEASCFISWLQSNYATSTIKKMFTTCIDPCVNLGVREKKIPENPYDISVLPRIQKKGIECFEPDEVKAIIEAFYSDNYCSNKSRYQDSYYAPMVEFLALTGCRPEECHALTWDDIKHRKDRTTVIISKAYSAGVFMDYTKNGTDRIFPCNSQLLDLIKRIPKIDNENNLVFPSINKKYMSQNNFRNRYWNKIVNHLVAEGKIKKRLTPYCLRHSFITRLVREGVDIGTIAALAGNSPKKILENYLASKNDFDLPEL